MDNRSLIEYILEGRQHKIELALNHWLANSERYFAFVDLHRDKIRNKVRKAMTDDDLDDVRFELELPYLFLIDNQFTVEYEKYGTGKMRAPDFTIRYELSSEFNVEVKRIRERNFGVRYEEVVKKIIDPVRRTPSSLGFSISVLHFDLNNDFIKALEASAEQISCQILNLIQKRRIQVVL